MSATKIIWRKPHDEAKNFVRENHIVLFCKSERKNLDINFKN